MLKVVHAWVCNSKAPWELYFYITVLSKYCIALSIILITVPTLRFTKKAKLIKTDEFSSVFNFRKRISAKFLALHYQPNSVGHARLGLVVGKKVAKRAVDRNYMRRVLREFFRIQQHEINPVDLVVRVQKKFEKEDFIQIKQEFDALIAKINQRTQKDRQLNSSSIHDDKLQKQLSGDNDDGTVTD